MTTTTTTTTRIKFSTLGQFIIDTFQYIDPTTQTNLGDKGQGERIGGGGTYAVIGARVWLNPRECLMVVDRGIDFKSEWQMVLDTYDDEHGHSLWKYRTRSLEQDTGTGEESSQLTTKAVNVYIGERREFKYLTPRLRLTPRDLESPSSEFPEWIHCVCAPERIDNFAQQLSNSSSKLCWEPLDDSASPSNLALTLQVMQHVHVFSPNHIEAALFLGVSLHDIAVPDSRLLTLHAAEHVRQDHLRLLAREFQRRFIALHGQHTPCPIIVIRSGAAGSVALDGNNTASVPSYHLLTQRQSAVTDVTGGGNAFLGGFVAALAQRASISRALAQGSVSASLAIEQLGLPTLTSDNTHELWNGQTAMDRLDVYAHIMQE